MVSNYILNLLSDLALLFPVFLLVFTFKGFFQALFARIAGDRTAQDDGFLTINPLVHIDILGLLTVLVVLFALGSILAGTIPRAFLFVLVVAFGARIGIPVPINENNFKQHKLGGILSALSGSLGNFVLSFLSILILRIVIFSSLPKFAFITLVKIFDSIVEISLLYGVLDLIPLPPFDGGKILKYVVPTQYSGAVAWLEEHSFFIVLLLFFIPGVSDVFFNFILFSSSIIKKIMLSMVF